MNPVSASWFDDPGKRFSDFVQKDYELKVAYLTNQFQRMWTRFNYFVVIEAALIGGKTIFGDREIGAAGLCFGFALSLVWYVMGAEDRFLVRVYRDQVIQSAAMLSSALWPANAPPYCYVGDPGGAGEALRPSLSGWRIEAISTTRLAALIPLAVTLLWLGLLIRKLIA
jgi:hypothetical protein